jgi:hypothetical protein
MNIQQKYKKSFGKGWYFDSWKHSLAAQGIRTKPIKYQFLKFHKTERKAPEPEITRIYAVRPDPEFVTVFDQGVWKVPEQIPSEKIEEKLLGYQQEPVFKKKRKRRKNESTTKI